MMNKKYTLKEIIDDRINKDDIYIRVISKKEQANYSFKRYIYAFVFAFIMINIIREIIPGDKIVINERDAISFDMNIKYIEEDIEDLLFDIPWGLNKKEYKVYTQKDLEGPYDLFLWNSIIYENNNVSIQISYNNKGIEMRDWFILGGEKKSIINGYELIIQKCGELTYISCFDYKEENYLIESKGINEVELMKLLKLILK